MLAVRDLSCVRGQKQLFANLSFEVGKGEWLYLKGANGSGKTSLLRILASLTKPESGEVMWEERSIYQSLDYYRSSLSYIGHHQALKDELTPLENLSFLLGIGGHQVHSEVILQTVLDLGLFGCENLPIRYLSAGQKRRVLLAKLTLQHTNLWLLDEPFNALDREGTTYLTNAIQEHIKRDGIVVLTSHQSLDLPISKTVEL